MQPSKKNLIEIHLAVLLFSFAALFAKLLNIPVIVLVFGRTLIATITIYFFILTTKKSIKLNSRNDYLFLFSLGIIYAVHWFTFFKSIQVSTVAIGVLTFSTFPLFVTFLEPYFFKEKLKVTDIISAVICLLGISLVVPSFNLSNNIMQGVIWGVLSGFTCALLAVGSRRNMQIYSSIVISFYQQISAAIITFPFIMNLKLHLSVRDILLLILLGTICTALTQTLYISSLKTVKAQLASIITCLEPVYAIIFAAVILNEIPTLRTLIGGIIVICSILFAITKTNKVPILLDT